MKTKTFTFLSKLKWLGITAGFVLLSGLVQAQGTNLLVNPGFEAGLNGWGSWGGTQNINTSNVHSGTNALEYTGEGGMAQTLTTGFTIGATYILSAWCVLPDGAPGETYIGVQSVDGDNNKTTLVSPDINNTTSFEKQEVLFTIPDGTVSVTVFVYQESGTLTIISDDFSFALDSPSAPAKTGTGFNFTPTFLKVTGGGAMPDTTDGYTCDCDGTGVTDATACLQAALDSANSLGKPLLIPYTDGYYKISDRLRVNCSVMGIGGMPTIKQTSDVSQALLLVDDMTGWIYNLHITGTYDGTPYPMQNKEYAHNIALRGVNGVTISNNLLETPQGDNIGDDGGANNAVRNVIITNNTLLDPWRCNISASGVVDRCAIMNNVLTYNSQYVDPIDLEPYQPSSWITNFEIGYNDIQSPMPPKNDATHFYEAIVQITAWFDPTPGGNVINHHNYGTWGAPFNNVTGYQGGTSTWTNILNLNNAEGDTIPGSDNQAPSAPASLTATSVTKTSISLSWTASTDDIGVTGYLVYQEDSLVGKATSTSYNAIGLTCGTVYKMSAKAYDAAGNASLVRQANMATLDCSGGTNLLLNPDFESPLSVGWTDDWGNSALDSITVRSGKYALKIGTDDGGRAQPFPDFVPGGTYILSAWGMLSGTGGFGEQSAYIGADIKDADGIRIIIPTAPVTDSLGWQQSSVTFTVPENAATVVIFVYLEARGITTNSVLTDDWSLINYTSVSGVSVSPTSATLAEGIVKQLTATIAPENASNPEVTWASSDTTIAKVSPTGLVQGIKEGSATITVATQEGSYTATSEINVTKPSGNMLLNPGIESALTVGWTQDWDNNQVLTTASHSGTKCLAVGTSDGGRAQPITGFVPGSTYTLSAWCMLTGVDFYKQEAYIGVDIRDASGTRIGTPSVEITDSVDWHEFYITFTVPANAASMVAFVYLEASGVTTNYVLTDDWALVSGWIPLSSIPTPVITPRTSGSVRFYPNPVTGQALNIEGAESDDVLSLFDMTGRMIYSRKLEGSGKQVIDLENRVEKGSYVVTITGKTGSSSQLLIVE